VEEAYRALLPLHPAKYPTSEPCHSEQVLVLVVVERLGDVPDLVFHQAYLMQVARF
jgi:hypothetical protein